MGRKKANPPISPDRTTAYAQDVIAGKILTGRLVRLACQRHLDDLQHGHERDLRFDQDAAKFAFDFFETILKLNGGEYEGQPFILQPFQAFKIGSLFGWKRADGTRRFRKAYIEEGKGNGKSPIAAGIGLFCMLADGEPRAEIYSAATKRDQAMILYRDAVAMVDQSPSLAKILTKTGPAGREWNLYHPSSGSWFRPLASEESTQSGPRPHCALIDEIHEHKTPEVIDMLRSGVKGRRQPLILEITNSGSDRTSICWHHHNYSAQMLEGLVKDDEWFAYVCHLDPCERHLEEGQWQPAEGCKDCDDWRDELVWLKANPNLGVSITQSYLRAQVNEAKGMPTFEGVVRRLNFCQWTQVAARAIPADRWIACERKIKEADLIGRSCCSALDIGATSDFTAYIEVFDEDDAELVEIPDADNPDAPPKVMTRRSYTLWPTFWLPESPAKRDSHTAAQIEAWRRQGFVRTTPGSLVDYQQVLDDIKAMQKVRPFRKLAIDRGFQGNWIAGQLVEAFGDSVVSFPQGLLSMNAPFREFLELVKAGRMHHPGHPVLDWMAGNCAAETRGGLIKPSKDTSPEKIDGITGAVMALGVALANPLVISVYESRGVLTLGAEAKADEPDRDGLLMLADPAEDDDEW